MKAHLKLPPREKLVGPLRKLRRRLPGITTTLLILMAAWILSGIYMIAPDELGVVQRFGKLVRTAEPGLHYHLPYPIEAVSRPKVTRIQRFEFGFRTLNPGPPPQSQPVPDEALMLTGDENIIDLWFSVQVKIRNATDYLFNLAAPDKTVRDAAEAAMREIMGRCNIDAAMTTGRLAIQNDAQKTLQQILDSYACGLQVTAVQLQAVQPPEPVRDAFKEVISAREEKNTSVHDAESYRSDILPTAKGLAVRIEREAEAYAAERTNQARGDATRFTALLTEYRRAKDVTRKRLYLETMEEIAGKARKFIIDSENQGVLPLLPLEELGRQDSQADMPKQDLR
ncbi:MAG: FtsH protease activity modulator HflK [Desulfobacterales bacterium]|nr:MAG: FtsH protease activity modulator HflK [Desulfobacterales bacterium]